MEEIGDVHCINVNEKIDEYNGLLEKTNLSCEVANLPSIFLARIDRTLRGLEYEYKAPIETIPFPHEKTIDETFTKVENELANVECNVKPFIESLISYSKTIRRIDLLLNSWKIYKKNVSVSGKSLSKDTADKILQEADQRLSEIETRFKEITNIADRSSKALSRIDRLNKTLRAKSADFPINGIQCSVDEKFLGFIEQTIAALEENSETSSIHGYSSGRQLANIKANVHKILEKIPEEENELAKQLMILRKIVEDERQAVKLRPEFEAVKNKLLALRLLMEEIEELIEIEGHMGSIATTAYLEAWVPKKRLKETVNGIRAATDGKCVIKEEPPAPDENVPTIIKPVPRILEAFEKLAFSFGYPKPNEINPVMIMAVTFPLLFGIMFADVGQGTILLMGGLILSYFRRKVRIEDLGDIVRYLLVGSGLIVLCGISSIIFGFLFGEFFGPSGIIHPINLGVIGPFQIGGFDPMAEPVTMLRLSILIGVALLSLSLVLRIVNNIRESQFRHTLISISWLWLLQGGFALWIYWGGISNMTKWFGEGIFMFVGLVVMPVLVMGITTAATESVMGGIQFSIEILIESLDHTISFGRLAALSLTHSALNYMFLLLGGAGHSGFSLQSIPIVIVGTILALTVEGLIIFVHTLRLHWVEWLPGFYSGKGIPFKPLRATYPPREHSRIGS